MARRAGPRGYVPARRASGPSTPAPLHPRLAEERARALEQSREYRARSADWRERLAAAKVTHARERGFPSRAAYERSVRAADLKFGLTQDVARQIGRQRYWNVVREFRDTNFPDMSLQEARQTAGFRNMLIDLYSTDRSPTGKLARALVTLGRRDPFAKYNVGDTPK